MIAVSRAQDGAHELQEMKMRIGDMTIELRPCLPSFVQVNGEDA